MGTCLIVLKEGYNPDVSTVFTEVIAFINSCN